MLRIGRKSLIRWLLVIGLISVTSMASMGCLFQPKVVLPQVGPAAVPPIYLPDRPLFRPFTVEEFDKIPDGAHGKILTYLADVLSYEEQADIAIEGYRHYIGGLFDKKGVK